MKKSIVSIIKNQKIANNIYDMEFKSEEFSEISKAGQFVEIYLDDKSLLLPRPISICDVNGDVMRIVYGVVGKGTKCLSFAKEGDTLNATGTFGNGFPLEECLKHKKIALMGGGIGIPPMLYTGKSLKNENPDIEITAYLGYRSDTFLTRDFENAGMKIEIATDDGSSGFKGNVLEKLKQNVEQNKENLPDIILACGPKPMLKAIYEFGLEQNVKVFVSMEERMACGFGACVGCAVKIHDDSENGFVYKKVCKDGPVFSGEEVIWND